MIKKLILCNICKERDDNAYKMFGVDWDSYGMVITNIADSKNHICDKCIYEIAKIKEQMEGRK